MDQSLLSDFMQWRLSTLKDYLNDESLTEQDRRMELEHQVRGILAYLSNESLHARQALLNYLTLLGFGYLIEERLWATQS